MRPDSLPRLWRYINLLLTYLLIYSCVNCVKVNLVRPAGYISALSTTDGSNVTECYRVKNKRHCFYTSGSVLSWDEAREFCVRRNSTLPIIRDENIDDVFQRFRAVNDLIHNRSVWLDARVRDFNNSGSWHWINGQPSGTKNTDSTDD